VPACPATAWIPGAHLVASELVSTSVSGSQQVINDLPDFQSLQWGFAAPLRQGFPSNGKSKQVAHKDGPGRSDLPWSPKVARACLSRDCVDPRCAPCGFQMQKKVRLGSQ